MSASDYLVGEINQLKQCILVLNHSSSLDDCLHKFEGMLKQKEVACSKEKKYLEEY